MMAFLQFRDKQVDVAVMEVGLGGRLDATNICNSKLAAITSIGLDHCEVLGDSIEKICEEKAGIIKPSLDHVVIGPTVPYDIVKNKIVGKTELHTILEEDYRTSNSLIA
jgi:folylpolyglutamate synthase/dihydropteroate synthase